MENKHCFAIAMVSGKGGVGKTIISANFAWECGNFANTILVDFDFQNQGATNLYAPHFEFKGGSAFDFINRPDHYDQSLLTEVGDGHPNNKEYFLPASSRVLDETGASRGSVTESVETPEHISTRRIEDGIEKLVDNFSRDGFEIAIFDCHGGLDNVSLACFHVCDEMLIVTEADNVTFGGTLKLIEYYFTPSTEGNESIRSRREIEKPGQKLKFVVNRVPDKFNLYSINKVLEDMLINENRLDLVGASIVCYFPFEELLSEHFGEHPFFSKLAPWTVFARKIRLLIYELIPNSFAEYYPKEIRKLQNDSARRRIFELLKSFEKICKDRIVTCFALATISYFVFAVAFVISAIIISLQYDFDFNDAEVLFTLKGLYLIIIIPFTLYYCLAVGGLSRIYAWRHKYWKVFSGEISKSWAYRGRGELSHHRRMVHISLAKRIVVSTSAVAVIMMLLISLVSWGWLLFFQFAEPT